MKPSFSMALGAGAAICGLLVALGAVAATPAIVGGSLVAVGVAVAIAPR
jgi:hypothetical protein